MKKINQKLEKKHHLKVKRQVREEMKANIILTASVWMLTIIAIIMNRNILMGKKTINDKKIKKKIETEPAVYKGKKDLKKKICKCLRLYKKTVIFLLMHTLL